MKQLILTVILSMSILMGFGQSDSLSYYLHKGEEAASGRQMQPAYQYYKHAVAIDASNTEALKGLADAAYETRSYIVARETYKKFHELQPKDTFTISRLAELNFNTRQWQDAIDMARKAKMLGFGERFDWLIARSFFQMEQYGSAVEYIERAWKRDSSDAQMPFVAARAFIELSNYRRAAGCYEQALRLDPNNVQWMYEAAMTWSAIPDDARAIPWFEKAIAANHPRTIDFLTNMANSYFGNNQFEKGLPLVEELLQQNPQDLELLYLAGEGYLRAGRHQQAIDSWDKMLAIDKNQARAVYMIGIAYIKKGDDKKGQALCEKAITMDPALSRLRDKRSSFGL
ncbi:tetratricopeptide repeat protein [Flavihumibacter stibioxidans]|uniref:Tetratricopeptide repeat protein n=1 Tax=Flavihumibacter stibioxidans TaxID=1834163 RepID=A0ABR7M3C3_9BACT|nr:tetratricopeptide repeat protein [Flavihumibacter stibioxidans]MBC6489472.1 hypothetical protein [Flavihumibacter stibioxidans]